MDAEKYLAIEKTSRDEISELQKKFEISAEVEIKIDGLEETVKTLQRRIGEQKRTIDVLHNNLEQIARDAVERYLHEEIAGSDKDLQKWREEFMRRQREKANK